MFYFTLIIALLLTAFLLTRLRLRVLLTPERKFLFVGLGRTGPEFDFVDRVIRVKLFGLKIRQIPMPKSRKQATEEEAKPIQATRLETAQTPKAPEVKRRRSFRLLLGILSESTIALWQYAVSLLKGIIVEEAEGELSLGFASPDVTGRVYGYYMALAGIAPVLAGRFVWTPNFSGESVTGRLKVSIALPMYVLIFRTVVLIARLPIRKIVKYSRGVTKGERHGE
jgi:hypothetical protein